MVGFVNRSSRVMTVGCVMVGLAAALLGSVSIAYGENHTWTGAVSSSWHTAGNWSPGGGPSDDDRLVTVLTANKPTITTGTVTCDLIMVYDGMTLYQEGGSLTGAGLRLGNTYGSGTFSFSGGTCSVGGIVTGLYDGDGEVLFSGSGTLSTTSDVHLGYSTGTEGNFTKAGSGTLDVGRHLLVGYGSGATGSFSLSAGAVDVDSDVWLGYHGYGSFVQAAGTLTVGDHLKIGSGSGHGVFVQSGGVVNVDDRVNIESTIGEASSYSMSGSAELNAANIFIGNAGGSLGDSSFSQSESSSVSVSGVEIDGEAGDATYNLLDGDLDVTGSVHIYSDLPDTGKMLWKCEDATMDVGSFYLHEDGLLVMDGDFILNHLINGSMMGTSSANVRYISEGGSSSGTVELVGGSNVQADSYVGWSGHMKMTSSIVRFVDDWATPTDYDTLRIYDRGSWKCTSGTLEVDNLYIGDMAPEGGYQEGTFSLPGDDVDLTVYDNFVLGSRCHFTADPGSKLWISLGDGSPMHRTGAIEIHDNYVVNHSSRDYSGLGNLAITCTWDKDDGDSFSTLNLEAAGITDPEDDEDFVESNFVIDKLILGRGDVGSGTGYHEAYGLELVLLNADDNGNQDVNDEEAVFVNYLEIKAGVRLVLNDRKLFYLESPDCTDGELKELIPGDLDLDGDVDLDDWVGLKNNFMTDGASWSDGDLDGDRDVDLDDFVILKQNFGS